MRVVSISSTTLFNLFIDVIHLFPMYICENSVLFYLMWLNELVLEQGIRKGYKVDTHHKYDTRTRWADGRKGQKIYYFIFKKIGIVGWGVGGFAPIFLQFTRFPCSPKGTNKDDFCPVPWWALQTSGHNDLSILSLHDMWYACIGW